MEGVGRTEVSGAEQVPGMVMDVPEQHPCPLGADTEGQEISVSP